MNGDDVGVVERARRAGFPLETGDVIGVARQASGQHFDGHVAPEPRIAGAPDLAHPDPAEQFPAVVRAADVLLAVTREAAEEARVDPSGVQVLAVLPDLFISRSGFTVTPVLAWWRQPAPVGPGDPVEVTAVARVPVAELADPTHRLSIRYPSSGTAGPAFRVRGMLVWGFTAMVVDQLLALGGWEVPWDASRTEDLPAEALIAAGGQGPVS